MKKINKFFIAAMTALVGFAFCGCPTDNGTGDKPPVVTDNSNKDTPSTSTTKSAVYVDAEGFDMSCWQCWDGGECRDTGIITDVKEDGVRVAVGAAKKCDGTYFGANLAAGTGYGANFDIDGKGFTKMTFKMRGTLNSSLCKVYILDKGRAEGAELGKATVLPPMDAAEWVEVTVDGLYTTAPLSSAFLFFADNNAGKAGDYVEIKDIQWLDADDNPVVPTYIE